MSSSSIRRITLLLIQVLVLSSCACHSLPRDHYAAAYMVAGVKGVNHPTVLKGHPKTVTIKSYRFSKGQYEDQPFDVCHMEFDKDGNVLLDMCIYSPGGEDECGTILKQAFDEDGSHLHWEALVKNTGNPKVWDTLEVGDRYCLLVDKDTIIAGNARTWIDCPLEKYADTTLFDYKARTVTRRWGQGFEVDRYNRKGQLVESISSDGSFIIDGETAPAHYYYKYDMFGNLTEITNSLSDSSSYSYASFDRKKNWTRRTSDDLHGVWLEVAEYTYW